jgi:gluconolactonase
MTSPSPPTVRSGSPIRSTASAGNYEGIKEKPEQEKHNVYRVDPKSGDVKVVVDDFVEPNGITFSPDEKKLYVIDTGFTDGPDNPSHIRVFDVDVGAGKVSNSKVFSEMPKPSITDGMRVDTEGNIWCSVGWGDANEDGVLRSLGSSATYSGAPSTKSSATIKWNHRRALAEGLILRRQREVRLATASPAVGF